MTAAVDTTASVDRAARCRATMWRGKGCCCTHVHNIPLRTVRDAPPRAAAALPARRGGHPASTRWDTPHHGGGSRAGDALACRAHRRSSISRDVAAGAAAGAGNASAHATRCPRGAPLRDSEHCCFLVRGAGASGTSGDGSSGSRPVGVRHFHGHDRAAVVGVYLHLTVTAIRCCARNVSDATTTSFAAAFFYSIFAKRCRSPSFTGWGATSENARYAQCTLQVQNILNVYCCPYQYMSLSEHVAITF